MKTIAIAVAALILFAGAVSAQQVPAQPSAASKAVDAVSKFMGTTASTTTPAVAKVPQLNINTATLAELDKLPQIGDARAAAIVGGRPYKSVQDLLDRKIVPQNAFDRQVRRLCFKLQGRPLASNSIHAGACVPKRASALYGHPAPRVGRTHGEAGGGRLIGLISLINGSYYKG
jgi:competence protein ComEA